MGLMRIAVIIAAITPIGPHNPKPFSHAVTFPKSRACKLMPVIGAYIGKPMTISPKSNAIIAFKNDE